MISANQSQRPRTFAPPNAYGSVDAGIYDSNLKAFGSGAKPFKIGELRPEIIKKSVGPGEYDTLRAVSATKPKAPSAKINPNSPSRPESFAIRGQIGSLGPGEYA